MDNFDLIVVGSGPGGYIAAQRAGDLGKKVLLVEKEHLGGVCTNKGCIPTKALLNSAKMYRYALDSEKMGVTAKEVTYDLASAMSWKQDTIETLRGGIAFLMKSANVTVVNGEATFIDKNRVDIAGKTYSATNIIVATGSSPLVPPIEGSTLEHVVTSDEVLEIKKVPSSIVIIGGGVIGIEFASYFSSIGTKVTVVELLDEILPMMDKDFAKLMRREMKEVDFNLGCKVTKITKEAVIFVDPKGKEQSVLISASSNPDVIETIATYCEGSNTPYKIVPIKEGVTDLEKLDSLLNEESSCFYVQQPNYLGLLEDCTTISELVHTKGAKFIMGVNPIACSIIKSPGECGADIAVGEGQPLGLPLAFGGPYLGFMATKSSMTRRLPGRIVGQTVDSEGNRGFVLTLQAREQHIRREKATSNICSNQAHCALTAAIYLSAMGSSGLKQVASLSTSKAHYLANQLSQVGFNLVYQKEFFNEFVTKCDSDLKHKIIQKLEEHSILGPLPIEEGLLWCCTEVNSKEEIDKVVELVAKVVLK